MLKPDGYLDWTVRNDQTPRDKVYTQKNSGAWFICHSICGNLPAGNAIPDRFTSTQRDADGRYSDYAAASVMFVAKKDGTVIQCFPVTASPWTSGGPWANTNSWAVEAEGGPAGNYSEPFTAAQEASIIRLIREWEAYKGVKAEPGVNLFEHGQVAAKLGYAATACASGRYKAAWAKLSIPAVPAPPAEKEINMTESQVRAIVHDEWAKILYAGAIPNTRKYIDMAINPVEGGFSDANGKLLPAVQDKALVARVEQLDVAVARLRAAIENRS